MTQVFAEAKNLRISARKARLVGKTLRGKMAATSLVELGFGTQKASGLIAKVLKSALANATNNLSLEEKKLIIKEVVINEGQDLKRFKPRSRGMANPILKKSSHIRVVLEEKK